MSRKPRPLRSTLFKSALVALVGLWPACAQQGRPGAPTVGESESAVTAEAPKTQSLIVRRSLRDPQGGALGERRFALDVPEGSTEGYHLAADGPRSTATQAALAPAAGHVDAADEGDVLGVIVQLREESILAARGRAHEAGAGRDRLRAIESERRGRIGDEHARVRGDLVRLFGKQLVPHHPRPQPGGIRHMEYDGPFNGFALLDVGVDEARRKLAGHPDVARIFPNTRVRSDLLQSVPQIEADQVWSYTDARGVSIDGTGVRIGIIDTGVDYTHADLGGCFGPGCKVEGGYDFVNNDSDPRDDHGHGTHVAATAAGNGTYLDANNVRQRLPGVAPGAKLWAYKVLDSSGLGYTSAIVAGIQRCADPNGDGNYADHLEVCSMSLGGYGNPDDPQSLAVDTATANGVVFTIAAGNSGPSFGTVESPGCARRAITVAASCKTGEIGTNPTCATPIASFSSRGPVTWTDANGQAQTLAKPDLASPGVHICAAEFGSWFSASRCLDAGHISISGTSMATPHVAGVAALLRQAHPEMTPQQIKDTLVGSTRTLGQDARLQGTGEIDALAALNLAGVPSGAARLTGVPLFFYDDPVTAIATFTGPIGIINTTQSPQTYVPSFATAQAGLAAIFDVQSVTIAAGASATVNVTVTVDHAQVPSDAQVIGSISFTSAAGVAKTSTEVNVRARLVPGEFPIDYQVDYAPQNTWNAQKQLLLTNRIADLGGTYAVSFVCCGTGASETNANITATASSQTITLGGGAAVTLGLSITAANANLANGRYNGYLRLSSNVESLKIPVTFYKGYGLRVTSNGVPANYVDYWSETTSGLGGQLAGVSQTILYLDRPGPYSVLGTYFIDAAPTVERLVVQGGVATNAGLVDVTLDPATATHKLVFKPSTINGGTGFVGAYQVVHRPSGNGGGTMGFPFNGWGSQILVNDASTDFTLRAAAMAPWSGHLHTYEFRQNGFAGDTLFTNTAQQLVARPVEGFLQAAVDAPASAMPEELFSAYGTGGGRGFAGFSTNNVSFNLPGTIYSYDQGLEDPAQTAYPDYPAFSFAVTPPGQPNQYAAQSPALVTFGASLYSLVEAIDSRPPYFASPATIYGNYALPVAPSGGITIGAGPYFDATRAFNYADSDNGIASRYGDTTPIHFLADGSWDVNTLTPAAWTVYRDGAVYQSFNNQGWQPYAGYMVWLVKQCCDGKADAGDYRFEMVRSVMTNGYPTRLRSTSSFHIDTGATHAVSPLDENPPAIAGVHLITNGQWSNAIDPAQANRLRIVVDPTPGELAVQDPALPWVGGNYAQMVDALATLTLEVAPDAAAFATLATVNEGANTFSAAIPIAQGASVYNFRVTATDLAGNKLVSEFAAVAKGAPQPAADKQPPTVVVTSPAAGATMTGFVTLAATAADNAGLGHVDYYVDGTYLASATAAPWNVTWNTNKLANGAHTITAKAWDTSGNNTLSAPVGVTSGNDGQQPWCGITSPANGARVGGVVSIVASVSDNIAVTRVDFFVDDRPLASANAAPWTATWDTRNLAPGSGHTLMARSWDSSANRSNQTIVTVTIGDIVPPTVSITSPAAGALVRGSVPITVNARDNVGVVKVEHLRGGVVVNTATQAPFTYNWDSTAQASGAFTLTARAWDGAGNSTLSGAVTVTADNTKPTVSITSPTNGAKVKHGGAVTISATAGDNVAVTKVVFAVNAVAACTVTKAPWTCKWTVPAAVGVNYALTAVASDAAGNSTTSATVTVKSN